MLSCVYPHVKVVGLFCLGYTAEAAALGFDVYRTRDKHPKWVSHNMCSSFSQSSFLSAIDMSVTDCFFTASPWLPVSVLAIFLMLLVANIQTRSTSTKNSFQGRHLLLFWHAPDVCLDGALRVLSTIVHGLRSWYADRASAEVLTDFLNRMLKWHP
jgi:hypothetical protein